MKLSLILLILSLGLFEFKAQDVTLITQEKNLGVITTIEYSPDGKYIASGSDKDNAVKIWDVRTGKLIGTLKGHTSRINAIAFNLKGDGLASAGKDNKVYLWDLNSWQKQDSLILKEEVSNLKFGVDLLVTVGVKQKVNGYETGRYTSPIEIGSIDGDALDVSVENKIVQISTKKTQLFTFNANGTENKAINRTENNITAEYIGNNIRVNGTSSGTLNYYNSLNSTTITTTFNAHASKIIAIDVNPVKMRAITVADDKTAAIWDLKKGVKIADFVYNSGEKPTDIYSVCFSPDGNTIATSANKHANVLRKKTVDNSIKIWNAQTGKIYKELYGSVFSLESFCFHPSKNTLYTLQNGMLSTWNLDKGERQFEIELHTREVKKQPVATKIKNNIDSGKAKKGFNKLKGLAQGKGLGSVINKNDVKEKTIKTTTNITGKLLNNLDRIQVSENGNYLVTQLKKDEIRLYTIEEGKPSHFMAIDTKQDATINDISFDPEERYMALAGSGDQAISIVDLERGTVTKQLRTEKKKTGKIDFMQARALSFNTKGTRLAALFNTGIVMVWDVSTWEELVQVDLKGGLAKHGFLNFSKDGKSFFVPSAIGILQLDAELLVPMTTNQPKLIGEPILSHVASDYIVSKDKHQLHFLNIKTKETVSSSRFETKLITSLEMNKFGYVGVGLKTGELKVFDPETGVERFVMVSAEDNAIFTTSDSHYMVTKEGAELVTFRVGKAAYPFEQFDAKFNRPDLVLKAMNSDEIGLIELYKSAYQKRLRKLGVKESDFDGGLHLPEVSILNAAEIPLLTKERKLSLKIKGIDSRYDLLKLNVWINDVPVLGMNGKEISGKMHEETIALNLATGMNKIQVSVTNSKGSESLKSTFDVEQQGVLQSNLYIVSIGVSNYSNSNFNLNYAAKDAKDIATFFEKNEKNMYNNIYQKVLTDNEVTLNGVKALKTFLAAAKVDDVVMVFIAGHGVLDANYNYYFGTHDMDFGKPEEKGLSYQKIEEILDGIQPLKKVLIMDTCHSGELEEDEVETTEVEVVETDVTFRGTDTGLRQKEGVSPTKMMNELFNDLRRGTGATVISSAGGTEFAAESAEWKNGLFTHCFLKAIKEKQADLDKNESIMLSEVQLWVTDQVSKISKGQQTPTTRIQNIALDYRLW